MTTLWLSNDLLNIFQSFLDNRFQRVSFKGQLLCLVSITFNCKCHWCYYWRNEQWYLCFLQWSFRRVQCILKRCTFLLLVQASNSYRKNQWKNSKDNKVNQLSKNFMLLCKEICFYQRINQLFIVRHLDRRITV